ncbi:MAG: protein-glutamate O-methyltransferase CheR [Candidatus Krumholzibacteria bacterium]|nr:protein-glutamate O-methyltransferase CheR [Candidatus Krumholzibacteria bacterium]
MELISSELDMNELAWFVQSNYGVNLSMYRSTCMHRRIVHRLNMIKCESIDDYFSYIGEHPDEIEKLMDIITIHVTEFFRDADIFSTLEKTIFPELIMEKASAEQPVIRVWSAGCSTGEETYSLAMLLEYLVRKSQKGIELEVFGTDLSEEVCRIARAGLYSREKIMDIPLRIRSNAISPEGDLFKISSNVRRVVKFRAHNLFFPPPFSMFDLIVCRNVLIHFEHDIRGTINRYFHSSLNDDGLLLLGKSEALGTEALERFSLVHPRSKIYRKMNNNCSKEG